MTYRITYGLEHLDTGETEHYTLEMDEAFNLVISSPAPPEWARLEQDKCRNCPLNPDEHPWCPLAVALNVYDIGGGHKLSHTPVRVTVSAPGRTISNETSLQHAYRSLLGLIMPTCGCPVAAFFKPMARFHLPFSDEEETIYRAASMYLLAQYFRAQAGLPAELDLKGLREAYQSIHVLNIDFSKRLRAIAKGDSAVNAVVLLDLFTKTMPWAIDDQLSEIRHLFEGFLNA